MKKIMGGAVALGALVAALTWGVGGVAAQDKEAQLKDRQATMKAQGAAMSGIKKYLDGEADLAAATKSADDLVKISMTLPEKFPKGTSMADFPPTHRCESGRDLNDPRIDSGQERRGSLWQVAP